MKKKNIYQNTLIGGFFMVLLATTASAQNYFVDPLNGSNNNNGTAVNQAWATIQKGLASIPSGATLILRGGTYFGKVTVPTTCNGTAARPTTIKSLDGELAIIDGLNSGVQWEGLFSFSQNQFINLEGIKVQNGFWYGINVSNSNNILVTDCQAFNTRASGIYANGCTILTVTKCNVRKACQGNVRDGNGNGTQEDVSIVASNNFKVTKNEVWDSTVGGSAGGEGIDVKGGSRDGEVSYNYVHDIVPLGIYIDAGSGEEYNIRVFGNKLYRTGGLGVAGELGGHLHETYLYNNVVAASKGSGVVFQSVGNGKFTNVYIVNNTFYNNCVNTTLSFMGDIGSYTSNAACANMVIRNNIFHNRGTQTKFSIWYNIPAAHVVSHNLFYDFKASANGGLSFTTANLTANDLQVDPQFSNVGIEDFSLLPTSPAINKGTPITLPNSTTPLFTTDYNGNPKGASWDMGAYEYTARVGTTDLNAENRLTIYPNPAHNQVVIEVKNLNAFVDFYDVLGKNVLRQKASADKTIVDISGLAEGIYFVKTMDKNNVLRIGKFAKK